MKSRHWFVIGITTLLVLSLWGLTTWATSRQGPLPVIVNSGIVCFRPSTIPNELLAYITAGCFSSSCTRVLEKSGDAHLDTRQSVIQFSTRFVLQRLDFPPGSRGCTADCGGGGMLEFNLMDVPPGTYEARLGAKSVGKLSVPLQIATDQQVCFDDHPPEPTATRAGPTSTPTNSPTGAPHIPARTPLPYPALVQTALAQTPLPPIDYPAP